MPGSQLSAHREMRFRWYLQVEKYSKTVNEVCQLFGVSRKTYYKWYNKDHGYGSNRYISKEQHPQLKLKSNVRCLIYDAKVRYNYGPKKMKLYVKDRLGVEISLPKQPRSEKPMSSLRMMRMLGRGLGEAFWAGFAKAVTPARQAKRRAGSSFMVGLGGLGGWVERRLNGTFYSLPAHDPFQ